MIRELRIYGMLTAIIFIWGNIPAPLAQETKSLQSEELQARLKLLEQELATERKIFNRVKRSHKQELKKWRAKRSKLASPLLDQQIKLEQLKAHRQELEKLSATLKTEETNLMRLREACGEDSRVLAEQLDIYLSEIPGVRETAGLAHQVLEKLSKNRDNVEPGSSFAGSGRFVKCY